MSSRRRTSSLILGGLVGLLGLSLLGLSLFGLNLFGLGLFGLSLFGLGLFGLSLFGLGLFRLSLGLGLFGLGLGHRRGRLLRRFHPTRPIGLRRHSLLSHQLDHGHRSVVALARLDLDAAGVAAAAVGEEWPDLGEQGVHHVLVTDLLENLSAVVQRAFLRVRDQLLRVGPERAGLRLGRFVPGGLAQR